MIRLLTTPGWHLAVHAVLLLCLLGVAVQVFLYDRSVRAVSARVEEVVDWLNDAFGADDADEPQPLVDEPATVIAHPAATSTRKHDVLSRYAHHGQHRAGAGR